MTDNKQISSNPIPLSLMQMPLKKLFFATLLFAGGILAGCSSDSEREDSESLITGEGIIVEGAWARPGNEGMMSAAYFLITNFDTDADTLLSVSTDVAQLAEVHESYEQEEGMTGMREAGEVEVPGQSTIRLQPGGLHVMLMKLTRNLEEGDEFELILNFTGEREVAVTVPVQS